MKTRFLAIVIASFAVGCAPNGMHPLATSAVSPRISNAIDRGPVAADTMFDLVVGVRMQNEHRLPYVQEKLAARGDALSPGDFGERFGATPADYSRFVSWLQGQGFTIVRTSPARTTVTVRGDAAAVARAFGVEVHNYEDQYGAFTASPTPIAIANEAFNVVSGVVGIDNSVRWAPHLHYPAAFPNAGLGAQTPADLQSRYNEVIGAGGVTSPGMGQTVAVLSTDIGPTQLPTLVSDLNKFLSTNKPGGAAGPTALATGQYTQVSLGGPSRDPATQFTQAYVENALDPEMVLAMAPYAKIVQVFTATNGVGLFTDGIAYIVNNLPDAHVATVSWGTCERGSAGSMPVMNALFAQARAQGQQWFFAAGDTGSDGCRDNDPQYGGTPGTNKILSAGWPASSPYVVGVGGTQVLDATTEMLWDGSGGGVSESFDKPAYQTGLTPSDSSRDEPDVAALAGGSGVAIVSNGRAGAVGGTSAATPIWAGVYAVLLQQKAPAGKGFTNALERFYQLGSAKKGFTDIVPDPNGTTQLGPGENAGGGYPAAAGYDLVTGWGTPNLTSLIANW